MDAGDWIALGAAVVALAAMGVAISQAASARAQAREARRSADAQVVEARRSASAAEEQGAAAKDQVELMKAQTRSAEDDRHQENAPRFEITWHPTMGSAGGTDEFTLVYADGPTRLDTVTISVMPGSDVTHLGLNDDTEPTLESLELPPLSPGVQRTVVAALTQECESIVFNIAATSGDATWGDQTVEAINR
ncbi:MAG: hypothetical protein M3443_04150 [Actinomycetota bacterium]|nr:hypothetical protein [Actinomycetota bacterium]